MWWWKQEVEMMQEGGQHLEAGEGTETDPPPDRSEEAALSMPWLCPQWNGSCPFSLQNWVRRKRHCSKPPDSRSCFTAAVRDPNRVQVCTLPWFRGSTGSAGELGLAEQGSDCVGSGKAWGKEQWAHLLLTLSLGILSASHSFCKNTLYCGKKSRNIKHTV